MMEAYLKDIESTVSIKMPDSEEWVALYPVELSDLELEIEYPETEEK